MSTFLLSQILVGFTIVFDLMSFQFKSQRSIVICLFLAASLNATHFILLEQWTAAGLISLGAIRYLTSIFTTAKVMIAIFSIGSLIVTFFTFVGLISLLACIGSLLKTAATFFENDKHLRQLMIIGTVCWIVHNLFAGSPAAVAMEVLFVLSNLIGYYRYYLRPSGPLANRT